MHLSDPVSRTEIKRADVCSCVIVSDSILISFILREHGEFHSFFFASDLRQKSKPMFMLSVVTQVSYKSVLVWKRPQCTSNNKRLRINSECCLIVGAQVYSQQITPSPASQAKRWERRALEIRGKLGRRCLTLKESECVCKYV